VVAGIVTAGRLLCAGLKRPGLIGAVGAVLCALWLQYPLRVLYRDTAHRMTYGAGGYATAPWQTSLLVKWLRDHPLPGPVYTNSPDAVYLLTQTATRLSPRWREAHSLAAFARDSALQPRYVVWFQSLNRTWLYDLREITSSCRMEDVVTFSDGCVYRCLGEGGPGISAVYRFWSRRTGGHLYTIDKLERDRLRNTSNGAWVDEDALFYAFSENQVGTSPVYCFSSGRDKARLYTMSETEKDKLINGSSDTWAYQGIAFYAYRENSQPGLLPVYRLLLPKSGRHVYAVGERERAKLVKDGSEGWIDEGVAWYAFAP
jgi:hypothetical protein